MDPRQSTGKIDLTAILDAASGLGPGASARSRYIEVAALLNRHFRDGSPVSPKTVEKWFDRNSIGGRWLVKLVTAGAREGRSIDVTACVDAR